MYYKLPGGNEKMKTALALGTFDGLHKGHREVLRLPDGCKKIAVIFPLPPKALITGKPLALMLPQDKETAAAVCRNLNKALCIPIRDFLRCFNGIVNHQT